MPAGAKMKLDIDKLEAKLIERYGKEKWEKKLDDFYQKFHSKNYEHARRTLILGLSKFIAEARPSKIYDNISEQTPKTEWMCDI